MGFELVRINVELGKSTAVAAYIEHTVLVKVQVFEHIVIPIGQREVCIPDCGKGGLDRVIHTQLGVIGGHPDAAITAFSNVVDDLAIE